MKLDTRASTIVESNGVSVTSSFSIARSAHMFNILSNGLYSDKIRAVIRETCTNAVDAHIMAGTPQRPIQVKLPSLLDRSFYVKDWGPGMSDEEVRTLYTTYGWSNKQDNEETVGAYGLGSKSPFAYTTQSAEDSDGFTVMSAHNGVKRVYTCYLGEGGTPDISLLHEGPVDEDWPTGMMVTFPVQQKDIREFHTKARDVLCWFSVTPEILGLETPMVAHEFSLQGKNFAFGPKPIHMFSNTPCAISGGVCYPINRSRLGSDLSKMQTAVLESNVHLFMPLGSVLMTPSREELQYTERTKASILKALDEATMSIAKTIYDNVTQSEGTHWEWAKKVQKYCSSLPNNLRFSIKELMTLLGLSTEEINHILNATQYTAVRIPRWVGGRNSVPDWTLYRPNEDSMVNDAVSTAPVEDGIQAHLYWHDKTLSAKYRRGEVMSGCVLVRRRYEDVAFPVLSNVAVVCADDPKYAHPKVRELVAEKHYNKLIVVSSKTASPEALLQYAKDIATGPLEGIPVLKTSEMAIPASVLEQQESRKLAAKNRPAMRHAHSEVLWVPLSYPSTGTYRRKLGDLQPHEQLFLYSGARRNHLCHSLRGTNQSNVMLCTEGWQTRNLLPALDALNKKFNLNISGFIVVTPSTASRFKLEESGFRSFFAHVEETLQNLPKSHANVFNQPELPSISHSPNPAGPYYNLRHQYREWGVVGALANHRHHGTAFWNSFCQKVLELSDGAFLEVVEHFYTTTEATGEIQLSSLESQEVVANVCYIRNACTGLAIPLEVRQLTSDEFRGKFVTKNTDVLLTENFWTRTNEAPEAMATMLATSLLLDNILKPATPLLNTQEA